MYYKKQGKNQAVVLLHGWNTNSKYMDFIFEALKDEYCVVNVDLAGFGKSAIDYAYDLSDYAKELNDLILSLQLESPILVAHSFGARVAFEYALNYPCKALFLTGAAGIKPPLTKKQKIKQWFYKKIPWLKVKWGSKDYQEANVIMKQVMVKCIQKDFTNYLKQIKIPVGLFWGSDDDQTPVWMAYQMLQLMPQATLRVVKGANHFAYLEHKALFLYDLHKFLKKGMKTSDCAINDFVVDSFKTSIDDVTTTTL